MLCNCICAKQAQPCLAATAFLSVMPTTYPASQTCNSWSHLHPSRSWKSRKWTSILVIARFSKQLPRTMIHGPAHTRLQLTQRSSSGQPFRFVADASHRLLKAMGWGVEADAKYGKWTERNAGRLCCGKVLHDLAVACSLPPMPPPPK